jgi:hypothetical protein
VVSRTTSAPRRGPRPSAALNSNPISKAKAMSVRNHLLDGEYILTQSPPFCLTTHRLMRYDEGAESPERNELTHYPRERLASVERVPTPDHRLMVLASMTLLGGFLLLTIGFVTSILAIGAGIAGIFYGSMKGEGYYQPHLHGIGEEEKARWRVAYRGSWRYIRTLQEVLRESPEL